jgi:acetyl esterase/lipase
LFVLFAAMTLAAQKPWQPPAGHTQIPIWPGTPPDAISTAGSEHTTWDPPEKGIAGKGVTGIDNVTQPTITVFSPPVSPGNSNNAGAAVVVFPGGGYMMLAIDFEGTEVCDWLVPRGITCIVLKYRVPPEGNYPKTARYPKSGPYPESPLALEDAQRAMGIVRQHAAEWHIDPHKIGVLGFSAGGHLVAAISTHYGKRLYAPIDGADRQSCRPDFAIALYPGHMSLSAARYDASLVRPGGPQKFTVRTQPGADKDLTINPEVPITRDTPPTFLLQAEDDHVDSVFDALSYYVALKRAGVPAEMHLYAEGNHAFGLRRTKFPITRWTDLVDTWLKTIGVTPQAAVRF